MAVSAVTERRAAGEVGAEGAVLPVAVLHHAVQPERVTVGEVLLVIRGQGVAAVDDVIEAVVLETAGTFSVLKKSDASPSSLRQVLGPHGDNVARPA